MNKTGTYADLPRLQQGRVHELSGASAFAFALLMAHVGHILFCGPPRWLKTLHPDGVRRFIDPACVLHAACPLEAEALWAAETALRSGALATVILMTERSPGLSPFRRLQLAAQASNTLGIVITSHPAGGTAAETRWYCTPQHTEKIDTARLYASLYKNKRGLVGSWVLDVTGKENSLRVDAAPAGEPVWPDRIAG